MTSKVVVQRYVLFFYILLTSATAFNTFLYGRNVTMVWTTLLLATQGFGLYLIYKTYINETEEVKREDNGGLAASVA